MSTAGPHGLGSRLSLWLALLTVAGLGLVCAAVYAAIAYNLAQRQDQALEQKKQAVLQLLAEPRPAAPLTPLLNDLLTGHNELALTVTDAQGRLLYRRPAAGLAPELPQHRLAFVLPAQDLTPQGAIAVLALNIQADEALLHSLRAVLALAAVAGALAVSAGAYWLVRRGLSPLHRLLEQTHRVSASELERRLDGQGQPAELQPLIRHFNALLDRLQSAYRQMESFNADVAHELNNPLATLIGSSEVALRRSRSAEELRDILGSNLEELRLMAGIVGDMLFLSRADRGSGARREPVPSLAALAAEVLDFHEAALQEAGLQARVEGDASAEVDARLLRRALSNLLGNATRYAEPGSTVWVRIVGEPAGTVKLSVINRGPAIAAEHLPLLFNRFYRADPARSHAGPDQGHHGLGLAIVAGIARLHGGKAFARSGQGETEIGLSLGA